MRRDLLRLSMFAAALVGIFALADGCKTSAAGIGYMRITIGSAQPKTILPTIPSPSSYSLSFTGPSDVNTVPLSETTATMELPVGTWTIAAVALDSGGLSIAEGSASGVVIEAGKTKSVALSLHAISGGTGSVDLRLSWPEGQTIDKDTSSFSLSLNGAAVSPPGTLSWGDSGLRYQLSSCGSGDYELGVSLHNSSTGTAYSNTFVLQVFGNLSTSGEIALGIEDFGLPLPPTNLGVSTAPIGFRLSWTDNAGVEQRYQVERGTDGSTFPNVVTSDLASNSTSYTDESVNLGKYFYRVRAWGSSTIPSEPSNIASAPTGSLELSITVSSPTDQAITFSSANDVAMRQAGSLTVSTGIFDSYKWLIDTAVIGGATTSSVTVEGSGLSLGVHFLTAIVTKEGHRYSNSLRFCVNP
jgi:hypothetical protein